MAASKGDGGRLGSCGGTEHSPTASSDGLSTGCVPLLLPQVEFDPEPGTIVLLGTALVGMAGAGA